MRTLVFDVPAQDGGALTILNEFYSSARSDDSPEADWIFVLGRAQLEPTDRIQILRFPWIKKSWFHRLWFDHVTAPRLVRKYRPDRILSLQNVLISRVSVPQTLYLQQPLPFVVKKYGLLENPRLWLYQHPIASMVYSAVRRADHVIVQTRWMKEACVRRAGADPDRIEIRPPSVAIPDDLRFIAEASSYRTFFYPASALPYKNHELLVEAVSRRIREEADHRFSVILTLRGDETSAIARLKTRVENESLPIAFSGPIPHEEVLIRLTRSVLVFPSYIETFGLPLLEARRIGSPVIASDCPFSREILDGYDKAVFFYPENADALAAHMMRIEQNHFHGRTDTV